jgi:hypothetical protein
VGGRCQEPGRAAGGAPRIVIAVRSPRPRPASHERLETQ